jgi:hypothetical protein
MATRIDRSVAVPANTVTTVTLTNDSAQGPIRMLRVEVVDGGPVSWTDDGTAPVLGGDDTRESRIGESGYSYPPSTAVPLTVRLIAAVASTVHVIGS